MQIHITMDKDKLRPELRTHDVSETLGPGQSAEDRIRRYLADRSIDPEKNPLDSIAVQITEDSGMSWEWKGWGHEKAMRWGKQLDGRGPAVSGSFPGHVGE